MNKNEVQSKRNVPFSWENKPGVSNKVIQTKDYENTKDLAYHARKIPPPPCFYGRPPPLRSSSTRGFKKQDDDPFYIAYKECTKSSRKGKFLGGLSKDDFLFGMKKNKNNMSSVFSCKHSCSVREDSVVINLSHLPISRSIREKR